MVVFTNKVVLVTGAGSGIGQAIACRFAQKGTNVLLTGLGEATLQAASNLCQEKAKQAGETIQTWYKELDLADTQSIDDLVAFVRNLGITPDFYVLNAGISQRAKTLDTDFEVDKRLMNVNFFGSVYLIKQLKEELLRNPSTHIAVTTSISGLFGFPLRSAYCASKHALFGFYESLALEYPSIKVTFLIPGRVNTQISKSAVLGNGAVYGKMDSGQANGIDVDKCARIAVRAIANEKHKKLIGGKELLMAYFYKYCPWLFYKVARNISAT